MTKTVTAAALLTAILGTSAVANPLDALVFPTGPGPVIQEKTTPASKGALQNPLVLIKTKPAQKDG